MVADDPQGGILVSKKFPELEEANGYIAGQQDRANEGFMILDAFTASHFVQIYDALSQENQAKMNGFTITKQVDVMWKLVQRCAA